MMRWSGTVLTLGIVAFWAIMNAALVQRQVELEDLTAYPRGVTNFLGNDLVRESWMGIYRDHRKIGYTGFVIERRFEEEAVVHVMDVESKVTFDLFGKGKVVFVKGYITTDLHMIPKELDLNVRLENGGLHLRGLQSDGSFVVTAESGSLKLFEQRLPLKELCLTNGLALDLPVAGFEVGQTYRLPVFDPILQTRGIATVTVKEKTERTVNGIKLDCYHLETTLLGRTLHSWVTEDGETVRQEIPPPFGVTLIRESRETVRRGIADR